MNREELKEQIKETKEQLEKQDEELKKLLIPYTRLEVADRLVKLQTEKKQLKWYQLRRRMSLYSDKKFYEQIMELTEKGEYDIFWAFYLKII